MAVLSRILTPAEIGLFIVSSTFVVLVEALRDFGIGAFLISETGLTQRLTRTAVTLIASFSLLLGGALFVGAPTVAGFYGDPAMTDMIRVATVGFLLAPISAPLLALLRRDMQFGKVASINICAGLGNGAATIALALAGVGPLSLVIGSVTSAGITAVGAAFFRPDIAIFRPGLHGWRRVLAFGSWSSVVTMLGLILDAFPRLILGRILGLGAVGLFARTVSIAQLPDRLIFSAVQPVLLPALADHARANGTLSAPFLRGLSYISGLQWPALAMITLFADPIVRLLLGDQWLDVVPLVRIVAPALFCVFPIYMCYPTLVACGRLPQMATAMAILLIPSCAIMLAASTISLQAMAASLFVTGPLQVAILLTTVRRYVPFEWGDLAARMMHSAGITITTIAMPAAVLLSEESWSNLGAGSLLVAGIGAGIGWACAVHFLDHPLKSELTALSSVMQSSRHGRREPLMRS
ncbi:Membrane protein involved in the export of O-antigen and teichoic acid [Jannaschia faecimaris]|uniref:Membrane protein involved in the export of O-antigen and teichoic acid n=2 Tax=Jannaschia faecimaris TaxID=1244108 RepID=A0A1H3JCV5_9RHOB|nr:Membrane protein involved in the export of O-antigen and teichoic acid [Jannaschia faecimaris]